MHFWQTWRTQLINLSRRWKNKRQILMKSCKVSLFFLLILSAVSCGIPEAPGNGSFTGNEFTLDSKVTYECNEGFKLDASQQATAVCQEDGLWSNRGKPPTCKRKSLCLLACLWHFQRDPHSQMGGFSFQNTGSHFPVLWDLVSSILRTQTTPIKTTSPT